MHPLAPIVSNAEGNGSGTTFIKDVTVAQLLSGNPDLYVNVHAGNSSGSEELPGSLACGDLRRSG